MDDARPRSTDTWRSFNPVFRAAGAMCHGQNPNRIIPDEIRNVISKNF
jgi:hypothetical protein